jgi:WD40 repeat protein
LFKRFFVAFMASAVASGSLFAQKSDPGVAQSHGVPLRLIQTLAIPPTVKGNFDHFGIDLKRNRLFATPEDSKAVLVFDLAQGKLLHRIEGIERPHAVWYREDTDRLYVSDGGDGSVKVYDANNYKLLDRIALLKDADSIGYDASRKYLYVDNGGGDVHQSYSMFSTVDTNSNKKIEDKAKNEVVVVDRWKNMIVAKWPITLAKVNVTMALDEQRQRLFVGCRDGKLVVLDSNTGRELQTLSITPGVDDTDLRSEEQATLCDRRRIGRCLRPDQHGQACFAGQRVYRIQSEDGSTCSAAESTVRSGSSGRCKECTG